MPRAFLRRDYALTLALSMVRVAGFRKLFTPKRGRRLFMKKSLVCFLAVAVMSLTLGLVSQDKMAPAGATGSAAKKAAGKKGGTGATGKM